MKTKKNPLTPRERAARLRDIERAYHLVLFDLASRGLLDRGFESDMQECLDEARLELAEAILDEQKRRR